MPASKRILLKRPHSPRTSTTRYSLSFQRNRPQGTVDRSMRIVRKHSGQFVLHRETEDVPAEIFPSHLVREIFSDRKRGDQRSAQSRKQHHREKTGVDAQETRPQVILRVLPVRIARGDQIPADEKQEPHTDPVDDLHVWQAHALDRPRDRIYDSREYERVSEHDSDCGKQAEEINIVVKSGIGSSGFTHGQVAWGRKTVDSMDVRKTFGMIEKITLTYLYLRQSHFLIGVQSKEACGGKSRLLSSCLDSDRWTNPWIRAFLHHALASPKSLLRLGRGGRENHLFDPRRITRLPRNHGR